MILFIACGKTPVNPALVKARPSDPAMSATNIDLLFSDSGRIQARLTAPLMNRYGGGAPYTEFPLGFRVAMYGEDMNVQTTITANRGIRRENQRIMEAWGNVIVRNELENKQLNTEHLTWDEVRHRIWSDVPVKITSPDQVLNGVSLESNDAFTRYSIQQATGLMNVKKDSI